MFVLWLLFVERNFDCLFYACVCRFCFSCFFVYDFCIGGVLNILGGCLLLFVCLFVCGVYFGFLLFRGFFINDLEKKKKHQFTVN